MEGNLAKFEEVRRECLVLATDYDGTLAHDGHVDQPTLMAMKRLRISGRKLILVTGRELPELKTVFPHLDLFEIIVAENGAVLYWPADHREEILGKPVSQKFIAEMVRLNVTSFSVGKSIFATWRPNEGVVRETLQRLGIDSHIIFNKQAVMVLPSNITKATGMTTAIAQMNVMAPQVAGIGDAENDLCFLRLCGLSAAVANALPVLKKECDLTMDADHGAGVIELIDHLIADRLPNSSHHPMDGKGVPTNQ